MGCFLIFFFFIFLIIGIIFHWGWFILAGFLLILGININYKEEKEKEEERKKRQIEINKAKDILHNSYTPTLRKMVRNYDLKFCPHCGEPEMKFLSVSPNYKSIEYECVYCHKKIRSKLKLSKDGSDSMALYNEANQNLDEIKNIMDKNDQEENVNVYFTVVDDTNSESDEDNKRTHIPESVRHEVWRRDQGKCVKCGSQENLEFDHIIPVSKGGSNTARNIQLLCEKCNRSKKDKI